MWCRIDLVWADVSEERIASVFRLEKSTSEEPAQSAATCSRWFVRFVFRLNTTTIKISFTFAVFNEFKLKTANQSPWL
jgi:hypothetical protein